MVKSYITAVIVVSFLCLHSTVFAQPRQFNYQAEVRNSSGALLSDGEYQVTVRIYETAFDATPLFSEEHTISIERGILQINIGSLTALPASLPLDRELYLGLKIGSEPELQPRT